MEDYFEIGHFTQYDAFGEQIPSYGPWNMARNPYKRR